MATLAPQHIAAIRGALRAAIRAQEEHVGGMRRVLAAQARSGRVPADAEKAIATSDRNIDAWEAALRAVDAGGSSLLDGQGFVSLIDELTVLADAAERTNQEVAVRLRALRERLLAHNQFKTETAR